jgi:Spy/CpxP family protein refolding chaperone
MKPRIPRPIVLTLLAVAATAGLAATACRAIDAAAPPRPRPAAAPRPLVIDDPLAGFDDGPVPAFAPMLAGGGPGGDAHMRFFREVEQLDLSDAQRDQLQKIRRKAPSEIMPKMQTLMEARMDLRDLLAKDKSDKTALRQAHQKVLDAQAALQTTLFNLRMDVRDVLTPEQRNELHKSDRPRARHMRAPRGGWGSGWDFDAGEEL